MTSRLLVGSNGKIRSMPPEKSSCRHLICSPAQNQKGSYLHQYLHWGAPPHAENWEELAVSLPLQGKLSHLDWAQCSRGTEKMLFHSMPLEFSSHASHNLSWAHVCEMEEGSGWLGISGIGSFGSQRLIRLLPSHQGKEEWLVHCCLMTTN